MKRNKILLIVSVLVAVALASSCKKYSGEDEASSSDDDETTVVDATTGNEASHEETGDYTWNGESATAIKLNTTSITVTGSGATASGTTATITAAGTYLVSGTLTNGQVIVETDSEETVKVVLNGVNITCNTSSPVYVSKANKVVVILADGTKNYLTDGSTYTLATGEDEPNATLFAKSDLSVSGNGTLVIDANYNDGIASKDGLIINGGTYEITSVDDGIRGKDYLIVESGTFTLTSGGDGFKSDNEADEAKGYVSVTSGTVTITSTNDAIQATTDLLIAGGTFKLTSGGGSSKTASTTESSKGLKSGVMTVIETGNFTISSADDAIHSNGNVTINAGTYALSTADDAIHAENTVTINDCEMVISKCYEGIEGPYITINKGNIKITASDDALNASKGAGGENNDGSMLTVNGGYIALYATADGLDSNGNMTYTGGTIIEHGPTSSPEVAMDYNGTCLFNGGTIVLAGINSSMNQTPSASSSQNTVQIRYSSTQSASKLFAILDSNNNPIVVFQPSKTYSAITFSSPLLVNGTYTVYSGGTYTNGTSSDGLLTGGTYTLGTQYASITVSGKITTYGTVSGGR